MFGLRYGEQDPYVLAVQKAKDLGYPNPGGAGDVGQAQRYMSSYLAAQKYGILPLLTNPLHEALLSWFSEGEGEPNINRLDAGYRGAMDALAGQGQAPAAAPTPAPAPLPTELPNVRSLLADLAAR